MFSTELSEALHESLGYMATWESDTAKSLDRLIKTNEGRWASEKQARFLLDRIDKQLKEIRASRAGKHDDDERWAERKGWSYPRHRTFVYEKLLGSVGGRSVGLSTSKARYVANVYVVDGSGVVFKGKVKVQHASEAKGIPHKLLFDQVTPEFERTGEAGPAVDPEAERKAAAEKNRPLIDRIKRSPDYESQNILQSFVGQLEDGRGLSDKQMAILLKYLPDDEESGDLRADAKAVYADVYQRFMTQIVDRVLPVIRDQAAQDWQRPDYDQAIAELRSTGKTDSYVMNAVGDLFGSGDWKDAPKIKGMPKAPFLFDWYSGTLGVTPQMKKAISGKKPPQKAIDLAVWMKRAVLVLERSAPGDFAAAAL
jgi:hypothetical protein